MDPPRARRGRRSGDDQRARDRDPAPPAPSREGQAHRCAARPPAHAADRRQASRANRRRLHGQRRQCDTARLVRGVPQRGQVLVVPVPGLAALGELLLRRDRLPRVPGRADPGGVPRLRPRAGLRRGAPLSLRPRRNTRPRADNVHRTEVVMSTTVQTASEIRPFHLEIPEAKLDDLRRRIAATRWPSKELVDDRSQGVQLAPLQELARYWAEDYDFGRVEARLNELPQFMTEIDGVEIHFIHVRSQHEDALPLIMTHGWPGSVIELLDSIGPLTDPTAHGGKAQDAFHLVLPSIPGYGFSGEPKELGWGPARGAKAWAELLSRLGYTRYVAQGGDVGSQITDAMGRQAPEGLIGIHTNLLSPALAGSPMPGDTEDERAALAAIATFQATGFAYFLEQATRPE